MTRKEIKIIIEINDLGVKSFRLEAVGKFEPMEFIGTLQYALTHECLRTNNESKERLIELGFNYDKQPTGLDVSTSAQ